MHVLEWYQVMSAVLAANALSLWFGYGAWTITKIERNGGKPEQAPGWALGGMIVPPLIGVGAVYLLAT